MEVSNISKYRKLTKEDRILIAQWRYCGLSNKKIARLLGKSVSTIGREISRNRYKDTYEPLHAQNMAQVRKTKAWGAKEPLKNPKIYKFVMDKLRQGWSPEQIAGRLKLRHPNNCSWHICPETIYHYIYSPDTKKKKLWEYLRRKQVRRRIKGGRKAQRAMIPDRVSIHDRPKIIDERHEFGHWEGDTVVGKGRDHGIHTEYERVSSLTRFERMSDLTSHSSVMAQKKIFVRLPRYARKSTTLDNGHEHVRHAELTHATGMNIYFADPYSSWQRGGNENANMWIRYYFPKGTDFNEVSNEELRQVEKELNNRPRKRLQYLKPIEVFNLYLKGLH